jgi:ribosomal protein S18 acetylase RimI-like enzyme
MSDVTVELASGADVDDAIGVWLSANRSGAADHRDSLAQWSQQDGARLFVARSADGRLAGMLLSLEGREEDGAGPVVEGLRHITGVAVRPELQGQGIGRRLVLAAIADAEESGSDRLTLWTETTNRRAQRLFQSVGFRPTGRVEQGPYEAAMVLFERGGDLD